MKNFLFLLTAALLISPQIQAEESNLKKALQEAFADALDGSSGAVRYRIFHKNDGSLSKDHLQYRLDMRVGIKILADGSLKVKSRVMTGNSYDASWNETGVGRESGDFASTFGARNLFLEFTPSERFNLQAGALMTTPPNMNTSGALALDGDGWIDGARASYSNPEIWADSISVTVGQVDEYGRSNTFSRQTDDINFIQIDIRGDLSKHAVLTTELTQFESVEYARFMIEVLTKDVVSFIDSVVVEEMLSSENDAHQGFAMSLKKAIRTWKLALDYTFKGEQISGFDEKKLQLEDLYRQGHQVTIGVDKNLRNNFGSLYIRLGKTVSNVELKSNEGLRVDFGYKIGLNGSKKKKKK